MYLEFMPKSGETVKDGEQYGQKNILGSFPWAVARKGEWGGEAQGLSDQEVRPAGVGGGQGRRALREAV